MLEEFQTLCLRCGDWQAVLAPDFGMNTLSLTRQGEAVLRTPPSMADFLALPEGYGTPPLLPANRTRDGQFTFEGIPYTLPVNDTLYHTHKHGFLHRTAFAARQQGDSRAVGVCHNRAALFPFPFTMEIEALLDENGYTQRFTLINDGDMTMPVLFAVHAAFSAPESCQIPLQAMWLSDAQCLPTVTAALSPALVPYTRGDALTNTPVGACCVSGGCSARIGRWRYTVSPQFTQWIVWNGTGSQGFLCVEPQTAPSNALNHGQNLLTLQPGKTMTFTTRISRWQDEEEPHVDC